MYLQNNFDKKKFKTKHVNTNTNIGLRKKNKYKIWLQISQSIIWNKDK